MQSSDRKAKLMESLCQEDIRHIFAVPQGHYHVTQTAASAELISDGE
jgi:hypothetical protein